MSILSGFKKIKKHEKTSSGYKRLSYWTSSQTVEFDDGKTAQEKLGGIDGITDVLTSEDSTIALSAKAGKDLKDAIDNADPTIPSMTYAEYKADYDKYKNKLVDVNDVYGNMQAAGVDFNNSGTHVDATNVQGAIAELDSELTTVNSKLPTRKKYQFDVKLDNYGRAQVDIAPSKVTNCIVGSSSYSGFTRWRDDNSFLVYVRDSNNFSAVTSQPTVTIIVYYDEI